MLEFVDLVNSTCLGRVFFVLSHQGSQGKGQVLSPQDSTLAPDGHQPSAVLGTTKYIYSLVSCHGCALGFFFEYLMCMSQLLTSCVVPILYRLITHPTGSLANADVRIWCLRPIPLPHIHHLSH